MTDAEFEKIAEQFCDGYCKFPELCADQDEMEATCAGCPITRLEEMINE